MREALILTPGAWAPALLPELKFRLVVRRKPLYWFPTSSGVYRREAGCPAFLFETPAGVFYGFPQIDDIGLKVARHSGGETVEDPLRVNRGDDPHDRRLVETFLGAHFPQVALPPAQQCVCMYTVSADDHFIVDRHPQAPQVAFAVGLSGHGFKFAPTLGQALVELVLDGRTDLPIEFLNSRRPGLTQ